MLATLISGSCCGGGIADSLDLLEVVRSLAAPSLGCEGFFASSARGFSALATVFLGDMLTLLSPRTLRAEGGGGACISTVSGISSCSIDISTAVFSGSRATFRLKVKSVLLGAFAGLSRSRSANFRFAPVRRVGAVTSASEVEGDGGGRIECLRSSSFGWLSFRFRLVSRLTDMLADRSSSCDFFSNSGSDSAGDSSS